MRDDHSADIQTTGVVTVGGTAEGTIDSAGGRNWFSVELGAGKTYPYGQYALSERVTLWGAAGYGAGGLVLTPEGGEALKTDMDLTMAAPGLRGVMAEAGTQGGPELAVKTDALGVRTSSEAVRGSGADGGNLAAATADVTRLRLGLEGTWRGLAVGTGNDDGDERDRRRLEVKLGYGFGALGDRFTLTPEAGFGMSEDHCEYSLAWRLVRDRRRGDLGSLALSLEVTRREAANDDAGPVHAAGLRLTARY